VLLIFYINSEKRRVKKIHVQYDDETHEHMKRCYRIQNHDLLLHFIKLHGLKAEDIELES
jgi:hypothetical protein